MQFDPASLMQFLTPDGPERVGFVLGSGEVVEVENVSVDPVHGFDVKGEDLIRYASDAVATWHTHPGEEFDSNLTVADRQSFLDWPNLQHHIVAQDGVTTYVVDNGKVLIAS